MRYKLIQDVFKAGNSQWRVKYKWGLIWFPLKRVLLGDSYHFVCKTEDEALEAIDNHFNQVMRKSKSYSVIRYIKKEIG